MSRVYIVIVNWNGWQDTVECLESVFALSYEPFTVIVCDNGSSDESVAHLIAWAKNQGIDHVEYRREEAEAGGTIQAEPRMILIRNDANLGFAGGNNVGMRYALSRGDFGYIWLLNNDTVVEPDALTFLVERMEQLPSAGMCGSTIRYYDEPTRVQALGGGYYCNWVGLPWHYGRFIRKAERINQSRAEALMNYVEGASLLVSWAFLVAIGLMCEDYFLYFEETDWAIRGKRQFRLAYAPGSIVYHKVGSSIGTSSNPAAKSYTCDYFNIRNRILFTRRFYPGHLPIVYLVILGSLMLRLVLGKWDRVLMIIKLIFNQCNCQPEVDSGCRVQP